MVINCQGSICSRGPVQQPVNWRRTSCITAKAHWNSTPETEQSEAEQFEFSQSEFAGESGEVFNEGEVMELTAELLEVTNEQELNHFLGKLIRRAAGAIGKVVRSRGGQALAACRT